jgi:hypothetical protein
MRVSARSFFSSLGIAALSVLSACGGGSGSSTVSSVTISPAGSTSAPTQVAINTQSDFTATVTLTNPSAITPTTVTWLVNGIAGGNSTTGTITASGTSDEIGIYTAPFSVPGTNNGTVQITATTPVNPGNTNDTNVVTSNIAYVQVTAGVGLTVGPTGQTIAAGAQRQFNATLNGLPDNSNVTWSVSSTEGGNVGTINSLSGLYTAPPFPPPDAIVTITATTQGATGPITASVTATITYSDASLKGSYAFSYSGNDSGGFYTVAGSFVTDGLGNITNGVEDLIRVGSGGQVRTQVAITAGSNYNVGADGRGQAIIATSLNPNGNLFRFVITTNQHAELIGFDNSATGSGSLDQQAIDDLNPSVISNITGPYVFAFSGENASFLPRSLAGRFVANGSGGVTTNGSIVDDNNNGTVSPSESITGGTIAIDPLYSSSGRGTLTLTSASFGTLTFAFYIVDTTHFHLVEIDQTQGHPYLGGDVFQGVSGNSFSSSLLPSANYSFVAGGNSSQGAYAVGGVFASSGSGSISSGALDVNNNGSTTLNATVPSCTYSVDPSTGRIDLFLSTASGTCASGSKGVFEFALYAAAQGPWQMVELDSSAISTGNLFAQSGTPTGVSGDFAFGLGGQGAFNATPSLFQPDSSAQMELSGSAITTGNFDINVYSATYSSDPVNTTNSSLVAPSSNGRGTAIIKLTNPVSTYTLSFYFVSANSYLVLDQDAHRVAIGILANQF